LIFSAAAISWTVANTPVSNSFCHRNARASALIRYVVVLHPRHTPGGDDDLRRSQQATQLVDDCGLDLGGRHAAHHPRRHAVLQQAGGNVVVVKPPALARVRRRQSATVGAEEYPRQQGGRPRPGVGGTWPRITPQQYVLLCGDG
jgi:hypothetical protein